jgi:uncharacterized protein (TIGR02996 family)
MTDGDALYRAILDQPDDDAPRLVWADWLEEHGDPERAAFVRLQCEWAALDPGDPRQDELWEQWGRLLERNRVRWGAGLGEPDQNHGFWRGLPDWFDLTTGGLVEQVTELRRLVPAQCWNLALTGYRDELRTWPGLAGVRCLDVTEGVADPFYPHSSARGWVWLMQSPRLDRLRALELDLDVSSAGVLSALSGAAFPHLRELSLRVHFGDPNRPAAAWLDLSDAPWFPGLRALDLWGCALGNIGVVRLAKTGPRALTRLNIGMNGVTEAGLRSLADAPELRHLRSIELNANPVGEAVGEVLRSRHLPALTGLSASDVIGDQPSGHDLVEAIVAAATPGRLRQLDLNSNLLDFISVRSLVESEAVSAVEVLSLNGNDLTDEAVEAIAGSPYLGRLRRLELVGNRLTDDALAILGRTNRLAALRALNLRHNLLSADGVIDFGDSALAEQLARFETDLKDPPPRRQWFET